MAIGISNNYSSIYASQKQQPVSKTDTNETEKAQGNNRDYFNKLTELVPSVECKIGTTFSSAKSGKTLTLNPKLMEKMQKDPEFEKEMTDMIKGVESMTRLADSMDKATGRTTLFRHSYIDQNGKYTSFSIVVKDDKLNKKLREETKKKTKKFLEKSKENAIKRKEELQKALEKKKTEKSKTSKAGKLINKKINDSKNGKVYMNNTEFKEIVKAMKNDSADNLKNILYKTTLDIIA